MDCVDEIFALFGRQGKAAYFGEAVSQEEHALQAAHFAAQEGAPEALVVAALLHDIGHLIDAREDAADRGIDARHEDAGCDWLARHYPPAVTEPVRLHVAAKRFLCSADPEYLRGLSAASVKSLQLQGGAFTQEEAAEFRRLPFGKDAVRLRHWDDAGKVVGLAVPGLAAYRDALVRQLKLGR
ncbi:MAG TPA: HD domain-containing protein [Bryobacteraceae bacterium]|nr:HD domain-containing protein [Bryobacteraceae bacterium]